MPTIIRKCLFFLFFAAVIMPAFMAHASHIVGGGFTYRYLGDSIVSGNTLQKYEVTLALYQDCVTGVPDAITQDNPAFFTIYETGSTHPLLADTSVFYDPNNGGSINVPVGNIGGPCGTVSASDLPQHCLMRKIFRRTYYLPASNKGYTIVYQRCCRNSSVLNIVAPGDVGATFFCTIPPSSVHNNSAVFNDYPPQFICLNKPIGFTHQATDSDGDSLSYEFCNAFSGATDVDIKPVVASPPPFDAVSYSAPYTYDQPISGYPAPHINPFNGQISGVPNGIGRYLVAVACKEWRNGTLINTTTTEFQLTVINCNKYTAILQPNAGENQSILVGGQIHFHATGGTRYIWTPGNYLDRPYDADPTGTFTKPGEYVYDLYAEDDSGCSGKATVKIIVNDHSEFAVPNAFTPNNDGKNDLLIPMPVSGAIFKSFRVYNRYGNLLYETTAAGSGWDGTYKNTLQDPGIYVWMVEYTDSSGEKRVKSGNVTLFR